MFNLSTLGTPNSSLMTIRFNGTQASVGLNVRMGDSVAANAIWSGLTGTTPVQQEWNHILIARDGTVGKVYINGVASTVQQPNATLSPWDDITAMQLCKSGNSYSALDIADFWLEPGVYLDPDIPSELAKFIDTSGKPVDLGVNGQLPTGQTPAIFEGSTMQAVDWNAGEGRGLADPIPFIGTSAFVDLPTPLAYQP